MNEGFAIAVAWPETLCKQAGSWYDVPLYYVGINRNGYYRVGHAAVVLVDGRTGKCRYFDFGRYHAPPGYGRVRSAKTDNDLVVKTTALFTSDKQDMTNLDEILSELHQNPSTHGSGSMHATVTRINFNPTLSFAEHLQEKEFIRYGPFIRNGANCSRFVSRVVQAGAPSFIQRMRLKIPLSLTPTPMWNLRAVGGKMRNLDTVQHREEELSVIPTDGIKIDKVIGVQ